MFVEHFCDKNALMVVVDFGKFHFSNQADSLTTQPAKHEARDSDDEGESHAALYTCERITDMLQAVIVSCVL